MPDLLMPPQHVVMGQNPLVDSLQRFLKVHPKLSGRRILICGDTVSVFVQGLRDVGASVFVACGTKDAADRVRRRFPDLPVGVRDRTFANPDRHDSRYDLIIIWDGVGSQLLEWLDGARLLSKQIWADSIAEGWVRVKLPLSTADFFPDYYVKRAKETPFEKVTSPLLVHVHVPKNGGSSTNDLLIESFGYRYQPLYVHDPYIQQKADFLQEQVPLHPHAQVISSHNFRAFPEKVGNRPMLYFTFLRHSLARHLSYYRYAKKHYHSFPAEHQRSLPQNFLEMSAKDYLLFEANLFSLGYGHDQLRNFEPGGDVAKARETLSDFFMVGVVEQLDRGLALLRKKLRSIGYHLVEFPVNKANTTEEFYGETGGMVDDPEVKAAAKYLDNDLSLYNWALRRFEHECVMYGV
jgi:hypothetical protein